MIVVTTWLIHCLIIAAVLVAAAASWELSARWSGRPTRWAWLGALAGSVTLPWLLRLLPERAALEGVPTAVPMLSLEPITISAASQVAGWSAVDAALFAWVMLAVAAVAYILQLVVRLGRARRGWHRTELEGGTVYLTRHTGPAAMGVVRGVVVLPAWVLELDAELRSLLLQHEREHVRAGDPRLLLTGLMLLATMPWNPVLWFALLRLRNAIEMDCDGRVLARGVDPGRYGSLLLEVGRRRGGSALVMATFAEPRVFLHERIRRIARWPAERRPARAAMFGVLALGLLATALHARDPLRAGPVLRAIEAVDAAVVGDTETPVEVHLPGGNALAANGGLNERGDERAVEQAGLRSSERADERAIEQASLRASEHAAMASDTPPRYPVFTPMTVAPALQNRAEVAAALSAMYPPMLRDGGVGGRATVWFHIDEAGRVMDTQLSRSSGYPALDEAALNVAAMMRFSPALNRYQKVAVWVELPIVFTPPAQSADRVPLTRTETRPPARPADPARADARTTDPLPRAAIPPRPAPAAVHVEPEMLNREEVVRALERSYPPMLRAAGIGGSVRVSVDIPLDGRPTDVRILESSGYPALDEAAIRVVQVMRFSPAQRDGRAVATRIDLPVVFTTDGRAFDPAPSGRLQPPGTDAAQAGGPVFTPMTVAPELINRAEVMRSLNEHYPPMLRAAGIGGRPTVWFHIDAQGHVQQTLLSKSSGHPAMDEAALRVAPIMKFSPALNRDQRTAVWVELPIIFTAR
jgi:TonB family protein